jgi:cbb3-type cytochrome oxidase cytochrome c subunit/mono/diheme cytochrome c family protein
MAAPNLAAQNRDTERMYPPGKLSFHFAVWSTVLLGVLVWMLWQDYDRPWKGYQKRYREKQIDLAIQKQRNYQAQLADKPRLDAAEKEAGRRLADIHNEHPELAALEERMKPLAQEVFDATAHRKLVMGLHSPARYQYEDAVLRLKHGHGTPAEVAEDRHTLNLKASELRQADDRAAAAQADYDAVANQVRVIRKPYEEAVKEAQKPLAELRKLETTAAGLQQRYAKNAWRNAPVIDFISPSIQIRQAVLKNIHDQWNFATNVKVDRCMTCHYGVDNPELSDESIAKVYEGEIVKAYGKADGFKDPTDLNDPKAKAALEKFKAQHGFERWMQPHPGDALIAGPSSKHQVEVVGCTVCHAGVGWSTDFSRAAHTTDDPATLKRWEEQHDRVPPEFVDYPMLAREYVQGQCFKCHKQGFGWPVPYVERLDHGTTWLDEKGGEQRLSQWRTDGKGALRRLPPLDMYSEKLVQTDGRPLTDEDGVQVVVDLRLPQAPGVVDGSRSAVARVRRAQERARLEPFFEHKYAAAQAEEWREKYPSANPLGRPAPRDPSKDAILRGYEWDALAYDKGEETIARYGCQGCHKMADFAEQVGHPTPPRLGPDLSFIADKVTPEWLERWIKHPDAFRLDTRMPSFFWFVPKNADWKPVDVDGKEIAGPRPVPVLDSHLWDRDEHVRKLGAISTPQDEARMSVQVAAISMFLRSQGHSRADPKDPQFDPAYAQDPIEGDWERGRKVMGNDGYGCVACHIVPEVQDPEGAWVPDDGARFRGEPAKGPRLQGLGSKLKDSRWLMRWLDDPKHYTATTQMPRMRFRDEVTADGTVVRTEEQVRADVTAYLRRYKNDAFDALPGAGWSDSWNPLLEDMWEEYFGRTGAGELRRISDVKGEVRGLPQAAKLARVGERLMARNGCFGCHSVKGHEEDQPIGVELSRHGVKDLHQLEFAFVHEVPHTRAGFYRTKITHPRIWDYGRVKRWTDQLKMPRFNFRMDDGLEGAIATRGAVAGIVLGQVDEPIQSSAFYQPSAESRDVIRFHKVVDRYGCNNCHPIEGRASVLWRFLGAPMELGYQDEQGTWVTEAARASSAFDLKFVPPNLFAEGVRRKPDFLAGFLKNPIDLRPMVHQRMPNFGLSDAEIDALVAGFQRLAGVTIRNTLQPESGIALRRYEQPLEIVVRDDQGGVLESRRVRDMVGEAEFLFDTINCNKCHLPKGSPGADAQDGGVAPPFKTIAGTLHRGYVATLLNDPQHLIRGTAMVTPWQRQGYGRQIDPKYAPFQFGLRDDPEWQALWKEMEEGRANPPTSAADKDRLERVTAEATKRLAEVQREALADYVVHHFRMQRDTPAEPR